MLRGKWRLGTPSLVELIGEHVQNALDEFGGILWVVLEERFTVPARQASERPTAAMGGRAGAAGSSRTGGLVWGAGVEARQGRTSVGLILGIW